ncbi:manganese ABC transporter substrate-binding protein [Paenibacillus sp. FSL R7-0273]|uniref:metal ABC transporter permease n=1 Tax=Paenibacillus sp. FSL R7-0273 TaxID=1536772 RepID=UPI0004F87BCC|nr:metal ABC transporter permease [Paenibacillus sp. FSL R7-0273]AIQ47259.1 manganese ABC transporter substrate-binding protein [Paenibacillus sp. FSL R7-0273]OMF91576.1 manganese ABC transporter substrate-binding protein [Paenibacillus sp. FSL R7-0273]
MINALSAWLDIPVYALNAGLSAVILGVVSGVLGSFIVLRKMSLMGDALSHAVLPGVALSYILGINILLGASLFGLLAAILIQFITSRSSIKSDTSIGIILSSFFALGIVLITFARSGLDLTHILFGNILAVPQSELTQSFIIMLAVIAIITLLYKELLISSFDPVVAKAYGLKTGFYHYLLMTLLSVVTVSSLSQVGIVLVIAMLVIPAATSYLWTKTLFHMILLASSAGAVSGIAGVIISFRYNLPTSATIVLTGMALFVISFILSPKNNFLRKGLKTQ